MGFVQLTQQMFVWNVSLLGIATVAFVQVIPSVFSRCWLGGRKSIWPVKNWVVRYWRGYLSGARCKWFAYGPADATATAWSLAPVKSRMVYLSGAGLPRLSRKKGHWMDVVVVQVTRCCQSNQLHISTRCSTLLHMLWIHTASISKQH